MIWPRLTAWDVTLVGLYLVVMVVAGFVCARRVRGDVDYFLAGRRIPWWAAGVSVVASMISSLTYLAMPGEAWKSGVTHVLGKMAGILISAVPIWVVCIPFLMRFRYISAYEYLEDRFGRPCRRMGVILFVLMMVLWMGFVILTLSRVFHQLTGVPLVAVVVTVGLVATTYTMLGGLRAVIWTDLLQVGLLLAGALATVLYVGWSTSSWLPDWLDTTSRYLVQQGQPPSIPWFRWDPTVRATVVTVMLNMAVWQICMHCSNQITLQRYFSTTDRGAARRSFLASAVLNIAISLVLIMVGLAVLHYYIGGGRPFEGGLDAETGRDLIFPTFAALHLPPGAAGAMLAALLAAAMSTVDSGVNCLATVITLELPAQRAGSQFASAGSRSDQGTRRVTTAMWLTMASGAVVTLSAVVLNELPPRWAIVGAIPRTFNAITGPLGGLFLIGFFLPRVGQRAAMAATVAGLITSVWLGYLQQIGAILNQLLGLTVCWWEISFTWIMPSSFLVTIGAAPLLACLERAHSRRATSHRS